MFSLPFFRRNPPALKGERVMLRMPVSSDYREWAKLRSESRAFLEPWEPSWAPDELEKSAWRYRLRPHSLGRPLLGAAILLGAGVLGTLLL